MKPTRTVATLAATLITFGSLTGGAEAAIIVSQSGLTTITSSSQSLGYRFTANSDLTVTSLGYYDIGADGLTSSHDVGLWDSSGLLLASVTVSNSSLIAADNYRYEDLTVTVNLSNGNDYYLAGTTLGDNWVYQASSFSINPDFTYVSSYFAPTSPSSLTFPSSIASDRQYLNVNLTASAVPEPSSALLVGLVASGLVVRRRRKIN